MTGGLAVGVGLGSNQGDRPGHLNAAIEWLRTLSTGPLAVSPVYETSAVDCAPGTPPFLNAVCEMQYGGELPELLRRMREFERERGRPAAYEKNTSRPLDLDILYAGDLVMQTEELTIPHPRLLERRFVLQPLCDIHPDLVLPGRPQTASEYLRRLPAQGGLVRWSTDKKRHEATD